MSYNKKILKNNRTNQLYIVLNKKKLIMLNVKIPKYIEIKKIRCKVSRDKTDF